MILVCGGLADRVTELVCARLNDCGYPYRILDLGNYPSGYEITWRWKDSVPRGYITGPDWKLDIDEITGVFIRYLGAEGRLPPAGIAAGAVSSMYYEYDTGLMILLEDLSCPVVNRIGDGLSNNSKAYQALLIRECGLLIPPTLVTNIPESAHRFYSDHGGDVIYKSLSGIRSIVRRLDSGQLSRLSLLRHGPAQFQAYIPGDNIRVHTVGDRLFATRIRSEAVDYRYAGHDGQEVQMEPTILPPGVENSCLLLAEKLGLLMTGIDLKETPEHEYYCFEVNPAPGFLYYEKYSGQPISAALADLLHHGASIRSGVEKEVT